MSVAQYTDYTMSHRNRVTHSLVTVTPYMAEQWLNNGAPNRKVSNRVVRSYADDMKNGRWEYNGQDIILDTDGRLIDGQHRLMAVIESGSSVLMGIKRGLSADVFSTIDSGRSRSAGDTIGLMVELSSSQLVAASAIARTCLFLDRGQKLEGNYTRREITNYFAKWPQIADVAKSISSSGRMIIPASAIGSVFFMSTRHGIFSHQDFMDFMGPVLSGEDLAKGDPRTALRTWALNQRIRNRGKLNTRIATYAVIRAWQLFVKGENINSLSVPASGFVDNYIPGSTLP